MAKKLCFCMLIFFSFTFPFSVYSEEHPTFETTWLKAADQSASTLFSTSENRALFSILLVLDYTNVNSSCNPMSLFTHSSYVGIEDENDLLTLMILTDNNKLHTIVYSPQLHTSVYSIFEGASDYMAELLLESQCDRYYQNSKTDLGKMLERLASEVNARL